MFVSRDGALGRFIEAPIGWKGLSFRKSERKWEGKRSSALSKVSTGRSDKPREEFPTFVW
ncbi:MAG: hypothetical protein ACTS80_01130 [Candidatus Hodgkinia cicadicola]